MYNINMTNIALIGCSSLKQNRSCQAKDLYLGKIFVLSYRIAKKENLPIFILSAKYGLITENDIIAPYDLSLKDLNNQGKKEWSQKVITKMNLLGIYNTTKHYFCGQSYHKYLPSGIYRLKGKGIGYIISNLKKELEEKSENDSFFVWRS